MLKKARKAAGKFVRTTITVPAELKARMDAVRGPVNWSQAASTAFAARLEELAAVPGSAATLEAMAERLRGARRRAVDAHYQRGWHLGHAWACASADLTHLVRLERLYRTMADEQWRALASRTDCPVGEMFLLLLCPDHYGDPFQRQSFWGRAAVDDARLLCEVAFVRGFFEAALDAWLRVKADVGALGWWSPACAATGHAEEEEEEKEEEEEEPVYRQGQRRRAEQHRG